MPDRRGQHERPSLGSTEQGVPLSWRNPAPIRTFGSRYQLRDHAIVFEISGPHDSHRVTPTFAMLSKFVELADANLSNDRVLEFARRWGMLGLCHHGLPRNHDQHRVPYSLGLGLSLDDDYPCRSGVFEPEPISAWRFWASQAAALMRVMSALRADDLGRHEDWEVLWMPGPWVPEGVASEVTDVVQDIRDDLESRVLRAAGAERDLCAGALETWLRLGRVEPRVSFGSVPRLELRNSGVFDSLGLLLIFLGGDVTGFAFCHSCRTPLIPVKRLGPRDRAHYCQACREEGRPARDAKRAYYRRRAVDPAFRVAEAARKRRRRLPNSAELQTPIATATSGQV